MNEAQKNAIREADNYLKAAGLMAYSEMQTAPRGVTIITSQAIDKIVYEHTKLNPNQADDQDLLAGIRKAILALTASPPALAGMSDAEIVGAIIESGGSALEGLPSNWDAGDIAVSPAQLVSGVRAITAQGAQGGEAAK